MQKQQIPFMKDISNEQLLLNQKSQFKIWLSKDPKHYGIYLTLTKQFLIMGSIQANQKQDIQIKAHDLIGYSEQIVNQEWTKITLNAFIKKKKFLRDQKRYLQHYTLYVYYQEHKRLEQLKHNLLCLSANTNDPTKTFSKKFIIYFNPSAGSNSQKHLNRIVQFMKFTNFEYEIIRTERRNHCLEHINNELDMDKCHCIVIVSGDGLMHEFVNSRAAGKVPVTHAPAGSGNAFAKYQMTLAGQACEDQQAIFLAVKGKTRKFNLAEFQLEKHTDPIYSFLSFQWCFMADIDMNSEFLRFLGGLRFELYGLWRLIKVRKYRGKFTFSTSSANIPSLNNPITDSSNFTTEEKVYLHKLITFIPWISTNYEVSPLLEIQDQAMDMQKMSQEAGRWQLTKYMLNCESGSQFDKEKKSKKQGYEFDWEKIKSFRLQPNGDDVGVFGIDGQMYQAQKIQAKISDRKVLTFG